ncbi:MAG: TrbC/VirB2 family protein [Alphaproteobacteria bacterium]
MKNLLKNKRSLHPLFVKNKLPSEAKKRGDSDMLCVKVKKFVTIILLGFVFSSVLFTTNAYALFEDLLGTGSTIFSGMREIVFAVSGFGIVAVAVGAFFGNLNWKWLSAIIIGLVVISTTAAVINYMTDSSNEGGKFQGITDTLIYAGAKNVSEQDSSNFKTAKENLKQGRARRSGSTQTTETSTETK